MQAAVKRYLNERELTEEMAEAFVDKVLVYENGSVKVYLKYNKELKDLLCLGTERGGVNGQDDGCHVSPSLQ